MAAITNTMEVVEIATRAAQQTDRWLFIATLIVFGVFAFGVIRWLEKKNEMQHAALIRLHEDARENTRLLSTVVTENSVILREVRTTLQNCANVRQLLEIKHNQT